MVEIARTEEEKEAIYRFRYEVYVLEQGKSFASADCASRLLYDDLDAVSSLLFIQDSGKIVATLRKTWGGSRLPDTLHKAYDLPFFSDFPQESIGFTSRLALHPKCRSSRFLLNLFEYAYRISRERCAQLDFCNCAPPLVRLMRRLGYRQHRSPFLDPDVGERIPMLGIYEDIPYLREVSFPFLDLALSFPNSDATAEWYRGRSSQFDVIGNDYTSLKSECRTRSQ